MSSDEQVVFDNWQEAAEELQKEEQNKEKLGQNAEQKPSQVSDQLKQQEKDQKEVQKPVDPKEVLRQNIKLYAEITPDQFLETHEDITESNRAAAKMIGNPILKSDKDFSNYAKQLAARFNDMVEDESATIDDNKMSGFFKDITLYMYNSLNWNTMAKVQEKLKVVKKERKAEETKMLKQKQREQIQRKAQGQGSETKSKKESIKKEDDLFGGAALITSKDIENERKNKILEVKPTEQTKEQVGADDDDDFM